ncbi:Phosphoribosyl-AMP cyclohydrolase [hydrothermal vent metagenome]|uniref:phosphoribosyl-AMP cyclohydrolase n=1 Tax=hydrothermal vent metagenome TaxID=652676 RepID=A0A3B0UQW9_9ZZZZ
MKQGNLQFRIDDLRFDERGLITAVIQNNTTRDVPMVAWMNEEALKLTQETGQAHFWSHSRQELWHKGGTSGNVQHDPQHSRRL